MIEPTRPARPTPRLSIIVATWNAAGTLERCLRSIVEQEFSDWELLIADGGSTDSTVEIIRRQTGDVAWWQSQKDAGIYDAWNQALAHARGEYVCFLGADDAWHDRGSLERLFHWIGASQPDIVSSRGEVVDASGSPLAVIGHAWNFRALRRRMTICHPGSLHRLSLFGRYGTFDSRYKIAADYDWLLRLPSNTTSLFFSDTVVTIQDGGVSRHQRWRTMNEYWRIQSQHGRVGMLRASITYLDRLWRWPVARLLGIYY